MWIGEQLSNISRIYNPASVKAERSTVNIARKFSTLVTAQVLTILSHKIKD